MRVLTAIAFLMLAWPGLAQVTPGLKSFAPLLRTNINGMATDRAGNIYVVGFMNSTELPVTPFAFQPVLKHGTCSDRIGTFPCNDAFLVKYDSAGRILFATYLGGTGNDIASSVAVDADGNVYVTGFSGSPDFPVTAPNFPGSREQGTFVAKFNAAGSTLIYGVVIAGSFGPSSIAVDSAGNAVVAGNTTDSISVTPGAPQSTRSDPSDPDGFVVKINARGTGLIYATYLGGNRTDEVAGIAVDAAGNAYVVGSTVSSNFPFTRGAVDTLPVGKGNFWDGFAVKINAAGTQYVYAARVSGSCNDKPAAVAVDAQGRAHITGSTCSRDFPVSENALQIDIGLITSTAFATALEADGRSFAYSTYLGGSTASAGRAISLNSANQPLITGWTLDWNFPTTADAPLRCNPDTVPSPNNRAYQGFVTRLDAAASRIVYSSYFSAPGSGGTGVAPGSTASRLLAVGRFADSGAAVLEFDESVRFDPPRLDCVAHAASFIPHRISPGQIITLFGSGIGPREGVVPAVDANNRMPTLVAGTRVLVDGVAAPILFARSDQINAVTPFGIAARRSVEVVVESNGRRTSPQIVEVFDSLPGIFQLGLTNRGAVLNQDGSVNTRANPAKRSSIVSIFLTGAGGLDPTPPDGAVAATPLASQRLALQVLFWGFRGEVLYSGPAPGLVTGLTQVNARIPADLRTFGTPVDVTVLAGPNSSLARVTVEIVE